MKKLLFFFVLLFAGLMSAFAQAPTHEQLTYQTVVRNAQNQLVFSQNNVSVLVEVCKADGSAVWYSENHTGLSTNANGLLTLMVGGGTLASGAWTDIDWSDAAIRTTITYDPGTGTVTIPSGLAPISAVPYALQAGNASNITNLIGDAIHDSIVNNISSDIHDSITNYLTNNNYVTETVMGSAIHDSITNNVTSTISSQIHDSIADINSELTDLENRVNTFNTHVCDSVKDCVTGWIHDSIASNIADNVSEQIHDSITNYLTNNNYVTETVMGSAIHDSITNNVTSTISSQIHDSIADINSELTDLENRVNTFNTHVCDSVKDCVTGWIHDSIASNIADNVSEQIHDSITNYLTNNNYVTETVMGSAIHDSITNNVTNTISNQIHDSIADINSELTDLENRVNTFNAHVCDSVKDCVTGWIHDSIANNISDNISSQIHDSLVYNINNTISEQIHDSVSNYLTNNNYVTETVMGSAIHDSITNNVTNTISSQIHDSIADINSELTDLENRVNTFNTHVCDSVKDCVTDWIHDSIANNISDNISSQIHDSIVYNINNNISSQIHDSIVNISGDLTDLENRVNTFNTHVCDSVQDCIKNYLNDNHYVTETVMGSAIHDSIANNVTNTISSQIHDSIADIDSELTALTDRVNTFNTHVCDSVKDCVTGWIHDSIANNISDNISSQIHDSLVYNINNNISEQIHDSVSNYLTNNHYVTESNLCSTIVTNCTNVALRDENNTFSGTNTVPSGYDIHTTNGTNCNSVVVNACDLFAVFDSLNRRINSVCDSLQRLNDELTALKNSVPPTATAPSFQNVGSNSMTIKANNTSTGAPITSYKYCYSTNADMNGATCQTTSNPTLNVTGLTPNTTYYATVEATNLAGSTTSETANVRTPAHAPEAHVTEPLTSAKPAGFKVEVTGIDPKEKDDAITVQVCYTPNTGTCPEKESANYTECKMVNATGVADTTISVTGLTPSTEYCAIVKVSNGDSTSIYGPYTVTTGADVTLSVSQTGGGTISLCGASSVPVTYTATPSDGDSYTYSWSPAPTSTSGNTATYSYASGTHTVTVTATHTIEGYTLTATASTTVNSGGTAATLKLCEDPSIGKVLVDNTNCTSLSWKNSSNVEVSTSLIELAVGGTITAGVYTVTGVNGDGCSIEKKVVLGNYSPKPCTAASQNGRVANTAGSGSGYDGKETAVNDSIISVKDYDGNEYPVVEIGSQCWMAVNLRTTHYADGSSVPAGTMSNSSTTDPYYYDYDPTSPTIPVEQRGYLYNWPAAMKTPADPTTAEGTQGVCPTGWHVPARTDWQTMVAEAGASTSNGAVYLSSSCKWNGSTSGTGGMTPNSYNNPDRNSSGFSAVPAGYFSGSSFGGAGGSAYFWSSSVDGGDSWIRRLYYGNSRVNEGDSSRNNGFSVRCLRD